MKLNYSEFIFCFGRVLIEMQLKADNNRMTMIKSDGE